MELCRKNDLEEGHARGFTVAGFDRKIILVRRDGCIRAYRDACPHYSAGTPMAWKTDAYLNGARTHLVCHAHGAQFDIDTGKCVSGPCLGQSLTAIPVTINQSGGIEIAAQTEGEKSV